ncbi:MAG TPA: KGG domain-containing protein [Candidatus Polarisedimenticolaceae bacterium]|nr:KGG domain-containing protein [Candidatus Polarisedimenticolaceae bacterium]
MADQDNQNDNKGQGWYGDSAGHAKAGQKGGQKTAETHDSDFYSEIGSKQGKENNPGNFANRPKDEVREAASRGGQHSGSNRSDDSND